MRASPAQRTLAAEVRAVEAGHQARLDRDGRSFTVVSDTDSSRRYRVKIAAVGETVVFSCDHQMVLGFADGPSRSYVPCRHGATVARRLEREGLLVWEAGRWSPTARSLAAAHVTEVVDRAGGARSNFEARCCCGWQVAVASLRREAADEAAVRHLRASDPTLAARDPFETLG